MRENLDTNSECSMAKYCPYAAGKPVAWRDWTWCGVVSMVFILLAGIVLWMPTIDSKIEYTTTESMTSSTVRRNMYYGVFGHLGDGRIGISFWADTHDRESLEPLLDGHWYCRAPQGVDGSVFIDVFATDYSSWKKVTYFYTDIYMIDINLPIKEHIKISLGSILYHNRGWYIHSPWWYFLLLATIPPMLRWRRFLRYLKEIMRNQGQRTPP